MESYGIWLPSTIIIIFSICINEVILVHCGKSSCVVCVVLIECSTQIDRLCATVCVQDPSRTPNAVQLDSMTLHSYIEQHAWTAGKG